MATGKTGISPDVFSALNAYRGGAEKSNGMKDDQLRNVLNDDKASGANKSAAFDEIKERLDKKVADGTATAEEKRQSELMQKLKDRTITDDELNELTKAMGVKPDTLRNIGGGFKFEPDKDIQ